MKKLSDDLRSLRGVIARQAEPLDGHIHFAPDQTDAFLELLDGVIGRAQSMEALLGQRPDVPEHVLVLNAVVLRLPARQVTNPEGGA
ncbi:hypothetical protein VH569_13295 [Azospirillum sp. 11R-A]|uniref:hypothetical protein n=1 Tax=Azospirillum sp. 11R-A TaxID=3111634 RepID=UPI003C18FA83